MQFRQEHWAPDADLRFSRRESSIQGDAEQRGTREQFETAPVCSTASAEQSPTQSTCIICMHEPSTIAFLHGDSLHTCCCAGCASIYMKECRENGKLRCPYCRQPCQAAYTNYTV